MLGSSGLAGQNEVMILLMQMAFRNLLRYFRRSLITMLSIAVGLAILLWLQCLIAGRNENMIQKITSTYTGHVQIFHKEYRENRLPSKSFQAPQQMSDWGLPNGLDSSERVHLPSIFSTGEDSVPAMLEGIEPENESRITKLRSSLVQGLYLEDDVNCERKEAYVGRRMAEVLHLEVGGKLVVMTQANDGTLGNDLFHVKGLYESGSPDFDKSYVFVALACAQKIGAVQGIHEVVIKLRDSKQESAVIASVTEQLQKQGLHKLEVTTWREAIPGVATMIRFNDATFKLITLVLFSVIVLGVVNTLLMNIFERTREFGVMLALGTTPAQLQILIVFESFFLGVFSAFGGTVLGLIAVLYSRQFGFDLTPFFGKQTGTDGFNFDLVIHPIFEFGSFSQLVLIVLGFIVLAGVWPAYRASKLNPIEVIRS